MSVGMSVIPTQFEQYEATDGGSRWSLMTKRVPPDTPNRGDAVFVKNESTGERVIADVTSGLALQLRTTPPVIIIKTHQGAGTPLLAARPR